MTLGERLREAREKRGKSLRDVERETNNRISNGYLSLLESNTVKQPSPIHLSLLADYFDMDYGDLMSLAGYDAPNQTHRTSTGKRSAKNPQSPQAVDDLSEEESALVEEYIGLLRRARKPQG